MDYPFEIIDVFMINFQTKRTPEIPEKLALSIKVQTKVVLDQYPTSFQVNLRLFNSDPAPLVVKMELVGLFKYFGTNPDEDKQLIFDYLSSVGIPLMWPTFLPILRATAAQMGINTITLPIPSKFNVDKNALSAKDTPAEEMAK